MVQKPVDRTDDTNMEVVHHPHVELVVDLALEILRSSRTSILLCIIF